MTEKVVSITMPRKRAFQNVYQFKITLRGTKPPIWRRIQVPETFTFYDLHVAIQDAMGWEDSHLHMFEVEGKDPGKKYFRIETPFGEPDFMENKTLLSTEVRISEFLKQPKDRSLYTYDYGDGWQHDVVLEKIIRREPRKKYPVCLAGKFACPPEDCGGVYGYYQCLRAVKNKDNSEGLLTWLGGWKPDRFDPRRVRFENPRLRLKSGMLIENSFNILEAPKNPKARDRRPSRLGKAKEMS